MGMSMSYAPKSMNRDGGSSVKHFVCILFVIILIIAVVVGVAWLEGDTGTRMATSRWPEMVAK